METNARAACSHLEGSEDVHKSISLHERDVSAHEGLEKATRLQCKSAKCK